MNDNTNRKGILDLKQLSMLVLLLGIISCKNVKSTMNNTDHNHTNKLINESSPYLLQHAHNPVDWYPWGEEALAKAKSENKLIIISIGYAACHWCHVMEHESFEDSLVASIMNEKFVSIKVDREERPDVDDVYMTAAQLISGRGGWPLNAITLPDGRPVFAGTYYPKDDWIKILNQITKVQEEKPERLIESADQITKGIQSSDQIVVNTSDVDFTKDDLDEFNKRIVKLIDFEFGGRSGEPKFPMPNTYEYLLKYHWLTGDKKAKEAVNITLDQMAYGGIYDQIGGGFARYSTDKFWKVPHFEKMLYDNGQLVSLYSKAYQLDNNPLYKKVVEETIEFIDREMSSDEGGFYSSLDADSEGVEGKFYVWTKEEVIAAFADERKAEIFNKYYSVTKAGNWEHNNILYLKETPAKRAKQFKLEPNELEEILEEGKNKLMAIRADRIRPGLDDKILSSWNSLMLKGLVDAYNAFGNETYLKMAIKNAEFLVSKQMQEDGRLFRNYKNGKSSINAFLDDYAMTIDAFIGLYQVTFDEKWLGHSDDLMKYAIEHFYNDESKMFQYTSDLDPPLIADKSELSDNVIPGSNSMMGRNLFTLGTVSYQPEYVKKARQMLKNIYPQLKKNEMVSFFSNWLQLYFDFVKAPYEVAIVGNDAMKLRNELAKNFLSNSILLGGKTEGNMELLKDKLQEGETYIYVCQNKTCKMPVRDAGKAIKLMK